MEYRSNLENLKGYTILIIGVNGNIGGRLKEVIEEKASKDKLGINIIGMGRSQLEDKRFGIRGIKDLNEEIPYIKGKIDVVIHCAGYSDYKNHWDEMIEMSTKGIVNALKLAESKRSKFIYLSSSAVYGVCEVEVQDENQELKIENTKGVNAYAISKIMCENIIEYYIAHKKLNAKILRVYQTIDPHLKSLKNSILDKLIQAIISGEEIKIRDENKMRTYIDIDDTVNAILQVAGDSSCDLAYDVCNPYTAVSNKELKKEIETIFNKIKNNGNKKKINGELMRKRKRISLEKIGWSPRVPLAESLRTAIIIRMRKYNEN